MLTFTHTVDSLINCPDMHSYTLKGDYIDSEGNIVHVAEYSANLPRMLKTLEYYLTDIAGDEIVYQTIVDITENFTIAFNGNIYKVIDTLLDVSVTFNSYDDALEYIEYALMETI